MIVAVLQLFQDYILVSFIFFTISILQKQLKNTAQQLSWIVRLVVETREQRGGGRMDLHYVEPQPPYKPGFLFCMVALEVLYWLIYFNNYLYIIKIYYRSHSYQSIRWFIDDSKSPSIDPTYESFYRRAISIGPKLYIHAINAITSKIRRHIIINI